MKKFGRKLLFFFLIPVLLIFSIELYIHSFKNQIFSEKNLSNNYVEENNNYAWINHFTSDSLIILSGSSSVRYGLSCSILDQLSENKYKYVNIAMDARDPIQTYFILKNIDLKKVSKVFLGLDPWIYTKRYYKYRVNYLYLDFGFFQTIHFAIEHDKSAFLKRYKGFLNYIAPLNSYRSFAKNISVPSDFGSVTLTGEAINFNELPNSWFQLDKYEWSELQFKYLKKMNDLCEANNVKFILFVPPKRSDYSKAYKETCRSAHQQYIDKLLEANIQAPIFGTFDQLDSVGDFSNFSEAYHLNRKGQSNYSGIFYELSKGHMNDLNKNYSWFRN